MAGSPPRYRGAIRHAIPVVLIVFLGLLGNGLAAQSRFVRRACHTPPFHTEPALNAQRACANLGVPTRGVTPGTYLFATPNGSGAGIFGPGGTLVWWQRPPAGGHEQDASVVRLWGHPYLAVWQGSASTSVGSSGSVAIYDRHYDRVGLITPGAPYRKDGLDLHEFRVTPDGDVLVGIDDRVRMTVHGHSLTVIQYVIQKLSLLHGPSGIHTGRVLFQWNSLRDVPLSQSRTPPPTSGVWDYFHGNSMAQDSDGNVVLSARNTWGLYKISVRTGHVMWEVGAKGDHTLRQPWCYQHDITPLGDHRYSLFDDGGYGPGCIPRAGGHPARGLVIRVDTSGQRHRGVHLARAYIHDPPIYSDWMGSIQELPDNRVLIGWGTTPEVTEYDAGGRAVALDLSLSAASYRAFSFPWIGEPRTRPAVAASSGPTGTDVWASWNGSTQIARWRVLGGLSPSSLSPVTGAVPKQGFETRIALARHYPYVAVQALDRQGQVLSRSRAVLSAGT